MKSSLEIAQDATLQPIEAIAERTGLLPEEFEPYGRYKAKVSLDVIRRLDDAPSGKLVCVAGVTPTKAGEGKTTTAVSLTQGLGAIGRSPLLCLREPSLGPVFGVKGGAAGGGLAQVVPMEDLNLHFTGDIHAVGAANNLLAALLDASILHGNPHSIDALQVAWKRALDMNDRALRRITLGLGGRANGYPRESGFDITAASEVMAILAVSRDLHDLRKRLGAITVARSYDGGKPVTAEDLGAAGAMTVLLKEALKPNLIQTLEGGALAAEVNDGFTRGGEGAAALAEAVADACEQPSDFTLTYQADDSIEAKIQKVATKVYGAADVVFYLDAQRKIRQYQDDGLGRLPICMAKTHLSLSADAALLNAPENFTLPVRDLRAYTGAGWLVPLCGDIQQMPGLGKTPAALNVDIDADGKTVGLF